MTYAYEGDDQKLEVQFDQNDSLVYWVKDGGSPSTPDPGSAYVTVLDPNGGTVVARTAATIVSGGKLTYSRTWTDTPIEEDYIAVWEWQVSAVAIADRQTFDVVKTKLPCPIDTSDLQEHYPNIVRHLAAIEETDATKFARRAWSLLMDRIRAGGHRPSLVMDRKRLINPAVQLMAALTCNALAREPGDLWHERASGHMKNFEALFTGLGALNYDRDEDGTVDDVPARVNRVKGWV